MKQTQLEGSWCFSGESSGLLAQLWGASLLLQVVSAHARNYDLQPPYPSLQRSELDMTSIWSVTLAGLWFQQWRCRLLQEHIGRSAVSGQEKPHHSFVPYFSLAHLCGASFFQGKTSFYVVGRRHGVCTPLLPLLCTGFAEDFAAMI